MKTFEINDDIFEESVKKFVIPPKDPKYRDSYEPIAYHSFDQYENYNRIEDDWDIENDEVEKEKAILAKYGPAPRPQYNQLNRGHKIIPIEDILNFPGRDTRPEK